MNVKVYGGVLIGGGYLGVVGGRGANLLLVRKSDDDLYGEWVGCFVSIHALVPGARLIGRFGLRSDTVIPFGFETPGDFYDQIPNAGNGVTGVFTFEMIDDVEKLFTDFLGEAVERDGAKRQRASDMDVI
jgi:hypothetical protein